MLTYIRDHLALWKLKRSPLIQALRQHTQDFFQSGTTLSFFNQENKDKIIQDFFSQVMALDESPDPYVELREKLTEYVLVFSGLQALCLTESEKIDHNIFADNPFISGELHYHIQRAAILNEDLSRCIADMDTNTAQDLVSLCNVRSAVALYYANGLNMVRIAKGDDANWYRPFVEAQVVGEEDRIREKLGLARLVPDEGVGALPYSTFFNYVLSGHENPLIAWRADWPHLYLAGEGSRPLGMDAA